MMAAEPERKEAMEEVLELVTGTAANAAKQTELLRMMMVAVAHTLVSGELAPTDPELKDMVAKSEATALELMHDADDPVEKRCPYVADYAAGPGGEAMAAALREKASAYAALKARAQEVVKFMRAMAAISAEEEAAEEEEAAAAARGRPVGATRPNAKYFGPEWTN